MLAQEIKRAERFRRTFSLLFFDLDQFKMANDTLGHMKGDELLKEVITEIGASIREIDTIARFGGDEFMIFFPDIATNEAENAIKRIRTLFKTIGKRHGLPLDISFGLVQYTLGDNLSSLLHKADALMYQEKVKKRSLLPQ